MIVVSLAVLVLFLMVLLCGRLVRRLGWKARAGGQGDEKEATLVRQEVGDGVGKERCD